MIFYESFSNSYYKLGEKVGKAWSEGKVFMELTVIEIIFENNRTERIVF